MDERVIHNAEECYRVAEEKAEHYFKSLNIQVEQMDYIPALTKDIQSWKQNHIHHWGLASIFSLKKRKPTNKEYHQYIKWLNSNGKLRPYLHRSISYIYLRDMGKALDKPETQKEINRVVDKLISQFIQTNSSDQEGSLEIFSVAGLFRWSQKEKIESTAIWLIDKLRTVSSSIPDEMDAENAKRKLIKIIAGVLMHVIDEMSPDISLRKSDHKSLMKPLD